MKNKFTKKAQEKGLAKKKKKKWPYILGALFAIGLIGNIMDPEGVERRQEERAVASSNQKAKEEEKKKAEASASSEENKKKWTEESNKEFASYFMNETNRNLVADGLTFTVSTKYNGDRIIHMIVPQDFKYGTNVEIQKMADSTLGAKNRLFIIWAAENGYDPNDVKAPVLYIDAEDGTTLAEESLWDGNMKLKVDNS